MFTRHHRDRLHRIQICLLVVSPFLPHLFNSDSKDIVCQDAEKRIIIFIIIFPEKRQFNIYICCCHLWTIDFALLLFWYQN